MPLPQTPCVKVCVLDPGFGLCRGCGRTVDEIARWTAMSDSERSSVMAQLDARMGRFESAPTTPAGPSP